MSLDPAVRRQIRNEWESAPYRGRGSIMIKWANILNMSPQGLYGAMELPTGRRRRPGKRKYHEIEAWATTLAEVKRKPGAGLPTLSTDQALLLAVDNGLLPDAALEPAVNTYNSTMRKLGFSKTQRRITRFQAEKAGQLQHLDASTSSCFYPYRALPDGDWILRLNPRPSVNYKNKPVTAGRNRLWLYGVTEDFSGYHLARYVVAIGESGADALSFLFYVWIEMGMSAPDELKSDHGPLLKGKATTEILKKCKVAINPSTPYNKESHGKIERQWRTKWQRFERTFYVNAPSTFEITLSELNRRHLIFCEEENDRPHRYQRNITRRQAYRTINLRGGIRTLPDDVMARAARRHERTIAADGCFSLDNEIYEVVGLHCAKAWIYRGIFQQDKLVAMDQATGERYEVKKFAPNPVGNYIAHPATPHQRAVANAKNLTLENTLFRESKDAGNVYELPTRVRETIDFEDPFDIENYQSVAQAMQAFIAACGFVPEAEDRAALEKLFLEKGLSRNFVRKLAHECLFEAERGETYG